MSRSLATVSAAARRVIAALALTAAAGCIYTPYTPIEAWPDEVTWRRVERDWWGRQLRAMREPSLYGLSRRGSADDHYRLAVLPTFSPGFAVRVTDEENGAARVSYVELDGRGGYEPGEVAKRWVADAAPGAVDDILRRLESADFWSLPTDSFDVAGWRDEDGDEIVVCADGTSYVIEVVRGGRYKLFDMHSCYLEELPAVAELIDGFLTLIETEPS